MFRPIRTIPPPPEKSALLKPYLYNGERVNVFQNGDEHHSFECKSQDLAKSPEPPKQAVYSVVNPSLMDSANSKYDGTTLLDVEARLTKIASRLEKTNSILKERTKTTEVDPEGSVSRPSYWGPGERDFCDTSNYIMFVRERVKEREIAQAVVEATARKEKEKKEAAQHAVEMKDWCRKLVEEIVNVESLYRISEEAKNQEAARVAMEEGDARRFRRRIERRNRQRAIWEFEKDSWTRRINSNPMPCANSKYESLKSYIRHVENYLSRPIDPVDEHDSESDEEFNSVLLTKQSLMFTDSILSTDPHLSAIRADMELRIAQKSKINASAKSTENSMQEESSEVKEETLLEKKIKEHSEHVSSLGIHEDLLEAYASATAETGECARELDQLNQRIDAIKAISESNNECAHIDKYIEEEIKTSPLGQKNKMYISEKTKKSDCDTQFSYSIGSYPERLLYKYRLRPNVQPDKWLSEASARSKRDKSLFGQGPTADGQCIVDKFRSIVDGVSDSDVISVMKEHAEELELRTKHE